MRLLSSARDTVGSPKYRVRAIAAANPDWVQTFNSPDELLAIKNYLRRKKSRNRRSAAANGSWVLPGLLRTPPGPCRPCRPCRPCSAEAAYAEACELSQPLLARFRSPGKSASSS